jgi:hypothetical protein
LSIYIPTDSNGSIDTNKVLTEEEFLEKTFISVRYRTEKEKEEQPGQKIAIKPKDDDEEEDSDPD